MAYTKSGIIILQNMYLDKGEIKNEYYLHFENGIQNAALRFPGDRQFAQDDKALEIMCRAMALRWGTISNIRKPHK